MAPIEDILDEMDDPKMLRRGPLGSNTYKLAWTEAAGRMRRLEQPGLGWSFGMAEREGKLVFDREWANVRNNSIECIHAACQHVWSEGRKVFSGNQDKRKGGGDGSELSAS